MTRLSPRENKHASCVGQSEPSPTRAAIGCDLTTLIAHVQASINRIEAAPRRQTSPGDEEATSIIVLDDVTPQYIKATCALNACHVSPLGSSCCTPAGMAAVRPALGALTPLPRRV